MYMYRYVCICIYVCVYIYIYIYTYIYTTHRLRVRAGAGMCKYLVDIYVIACWLYYNCKHVINRLSVVSALRIM